MDSGTIRVAVKFRMGNSLLRIILYVTPIELVVSFYGALFFNILGCELDFARTTRVTYGITFEYIKSECDS